MINHIRSWAKRKKKEKDVATVARKNYQLQSDLFSRAFVLYNAYTHLVCFGEKETFFVLFQVMIIIPLLN